MGEKNDSGATKGALVKNYRREILLVIISAIITAFISVNIENTFATKDAEKAAETRMTTVILKLMDRKDENMDLDEAIGELQGFIRDKDGEIREKNQVIEDLKSEASMKLDGSVVAPKLVIDGRNRKTTREKAGVGLSYMRTSHFIRNR